MGGIGSLKANKSCFHHQTERQNKFYFFSSSSDTRGHRRQPGERQQQEAGGEAGDGGHPHVRRLLAPHTAHPSTEVCPALSSHHPQHLHTGQRPQIISTKLILSLSKA